MDQQESTTDELNEESATLRRETGTIKPLSTRTEQARDELHSFFSQSPNLQCIAGFDGYFKRLNPIWTSRLGWAVEELRAKPFLDFVHPNDHVVMRVQVELLVKGQETTCFENRCCHKDGSYHWLRWSMWVVPEHHQIFAIARDITREKRQEREILEIADREKERLGLELHDGLCQNLAGIAALSSTLSKQLAAHSDTAASAAAAEIKQLLNESIRQARDLAHGLSPIGLNNIGLPGSLETLALNTQQWFRVSSTLVCGREFPRLHSEVEGHLFRIAQEAVNNAVVHGRPDHIKIILCLKDQEGTLSILDNGVGMPENPVDSDGIGLHTMFYRARLIGGSLKVRQRITGSGMAVICVFPLLETPETSEELGYVRNDT